MDNINGKVRFETDNNQVFEGTISLTSVWPTGTSEIVAYNDISTALRWVVYLKRDGSKLYESGRIYQAETCKIHLDDLGLTAGSIIRLKAAVIGGADKYAVVDIEYIPNSGTAYFGYVIPTGLERIVDYFCYIPSNTKPPILPCTTLKTHHSGSARERWQLITNGSAIITSGIKNNGDDWAIDLRTLNLEPGTLLTLKAAVIGGGDSTAYVILRYEPNSGTTAWFEFIGPTLRNCIMLTSIGSVY